MSIIVQLNDGADRAASLASINEAVAGAVPGSAATVEREYDNALDGYALKAPAGSLSAIRAANGVKAASLSARPPSRMPTTRSLARERRTPPVPQPRTPPTSAPS